MPFAVIAALRSDSEAARAQLRLEHLEYINENKDQIIAGGPTVRAGKPETMIIFTNFIERRDAESFIHREPYTASGRVFAEVQVLDWSQVLPERLVDQLERAIEKEAHRNWGKT